MKFFRFSMFFAAFGLLMAACQPDADLITPAQTDAVQVRSTSNQPNYVFVMTNAPEGNEVVSYRQGADGSLAEVASLATGGDGGNLTGSSIDPLAAQDHLIVDGQRRKLFVANPGSNTVSMINVLGNGGLKLADVVPSGGSFPVSLATDGKRLFIVNAADGGSVQGYAIQGNKLTALGNLPQVGANAGDIEISPDGNSLLVTERASGDIVVVPITAGGSFGSPTRVASPTPTPFGTDIRSDGILLVSEANAPGGPPAVANGSTVSSFRIAADGTLSLVSGAVATNQTAACWVELNDAGTYAYSSNTPSGTLSSFAVAPDGSLTLLESVAGASGGPGILDTETTGDYLYGIVAGLESIVVFRINGDGSLTGLPALNVSDDRFVSGFFTGIAGF